MIRVAYIITVRHAVTAAPLTASEAWLVGEPPAGISAVIRGGRVVVTVDDEIVDRKQQLHVDVGLRASAPYPPSMLKFRGARKLRELPVPHAPETPVERELLARPIPISLDLQLIDIDGRPIRNAKPAVEGSAKSRLPVPEMSDGEPGHIGWYHLPAQAWSSEFVDGHIHVGKLRAPLGITFRSPVAKRRLIVQDQGLESVN